MSRSRVMVVSLSLLSHSLSASLFTSHRLSNHEFDSVDALLLVDFCVPRHDVSSHLLSERKRLFRRIFPFFKKWRGQMISMWRERFSGVTLKRIFPPPAISLLKVGLVYSGVSFDAERSHMAMIGGNVDAPVSVDRDELLYPESHRGHDERRSQPRKT